MRNAIIRRGVILIMEKVYDTLNTWMDSERLIVRLKFSLYIILLFAIFFLLWQQMVNNMRMDIVKTLSILNILPTAYLAGHEELLKTLNTSGLIS